jgi:protein TonB
VNRPVRLLVVVLVTMAVNVLLFGASDLLTRERPLRADTTVPVPVSLVHREAPRPPEPQPRREPPPPRDRPRPEFTPDLTPPSLTAPAVAGVQVDMQLDFEPGGLAGPVVFDGTDLDEAPRELARVRPVYPYRARQRGVEGEVTVKLLVRADGTVGEIEVLAATPRGYFEDSVLRTAEDWRFAPGRIAGEAVASWVVTTLRFQMED